MKKAIYLYLGSKYIGELKVENVRMRETYMFQFAAEYLNPKNPILDPSIANVRGPQFPVIGGIFGFLSDVAPDRWGRKLIRRKEKRELSESDFLLGVCDATRQGALRLKLDKDGPFVSDDTKDAAPPWTTLRKLESAALHIDADDHGGEEERWVRDLFAPGSSLGGARPKANVTSPDGSVWIAKFPSVKDDWDVGLKEYEASVLARKAGLLVPETQCKKLSKAGTTFFSKRFDRNGDERVHYASAMTMIGAKDGEENHSYLEIAEFIAAHSVDPIADLHELWGRMAFSTIIGNTDDHLRNHGFLLTERGWRLSPMFDVNPNPHGGVSALDIGDLFDDSEYYRLTKKEAKQRYDEMYSLIKDLAPNFIQKGLTLLP